MKPYLMTAFWTRTAVEVAGAVADFVGTSVLWLVVMA
jgi:hypothetical protein